MLSQADLLATVAGWPESLGDWFGELAGKLEFCTPGMPRDMAERMAFLELESRAPKKQTTLDLETTR